LISRADLNERVREWELREDIVEKDYVIGWVLWAIGSDPRLSTTWAFKGGTCLKKCYMETFRFSEDLDFTVLPGGPIEPDEVLPVLMEIFPRVLEASGIDLTVREPLIRLRPGGQSVEGRIYYRGPRSAPQEASLKIDLTSAEQVVRPSVLRLISHQYPDLLPEPATIRCYGFEEVFAEKLRAMGERSRARDLYDIVHLFRRREFISHADLIRSVYVEKCESKGVPVFTYSDIESSPNRAELEGEWANMLGHQLPALPPFESIWEELPNLFLWLEGKLVPEELPAISISDNVEPGWSPPTTAWIWGESIPLESVRFAGTNHLCIELGYQSSVRVIEPYSLRRTIDGNLLLYATKVETGELRSYRVDRIQSIKVTNQPFRPRVRVEFTESGMLPAPPVQRVASVSYTNTGRRRRSQTRRIVHIIKCNYCGKQFRRTKRDTRMRPHKQLGNTYDCPGRNGYEVNTVYL